MTQGPDRDDICLGRPGKCSLETSGMVALALSARAVTSD